VPLAAGGPYNTASFEGLAAAKAQDRSGQHNNADPPRVGRFWKKGDLMKPLLSFSRLTDAVTERIGRTVYWLVLVAALISAANATVRFAFNMSSNAWLEVQWYLFSAIFLLGAGYALLHHAHVRIDVLSSRLSKRMQIWIDILGTIFFLLPMAIFIMWLSWPVFVNAFQFKEYSPSAGGLILWPARLLVPVGFFLLVMQGLSELIKRFAYLKGLILDPTEKHEGPSAEEQLALDILKERGQKQ
jgi:TRAP-type mannitol/chloroaromatic compound transport system permease small subunit